jgi:hypothetical protein
MTSKTNISKTGFSLGWLAVVCAMIGCNSCYRPGYHMRLGRLRPPPDVTCWRGNEECHGYHQTNWRSWEESCGLETLAEASEQWIEEPMQHMPSVAPSEQLPPPKTSQAPAKQQRYRR